MEPILHPGLPDLPALPPSGRALPGTAPAPDGDWLRQDAAWPAQMALRDRLIAMRPQAVHALLPGAAPAAAEALALVLDTLRARPGFQVSADRVVRPDGVAVPLEAGAPLRTLGRLAAEDFCLLEERGGALVLTGAILCFPSGWTLAEKIGRPLDALHAPVAAYDAGLAARVARMLAHLRPGPGLVRLNAHFRARATLFHPRTEAEGDPPADPATAPYVRSERQVLRRLPETGAILFSIHTRVVARAALAPGQAEAIAAYGRAVAE